MERRNSSEEYALVEQPPQYMNPMTAVRIMGCTFVPVLGFAALLALLNHQMGEKFGIGTLGQNGTHHTNATGNGTGI